MRRAMMAVAVCAAAIGLVAVPGAVAKKGPKQVPGTVTVTAPNPPAGTTTTTASGNVQATSSCRKGRTVHLKLVKADGTASPEVVTTTKSNGDFTATITAPAQPAPVPPATTSPPTTYTLQTSVDQANRKSGKGKKARRFVCLTIEGPDVPVTVS